MHDRHTPLGELALTVHRYGAEARAREREARRQALAAVRLARRKDPEELGLERCPECGWWRDPVPDFARESVSAFRAYLRAASARCMCTTDRCFRCDDPMYPDRPAPLYYSPDRKEIVRSGGYPQAMAHSRRCRVG